MRVLLAQGQQTDADNRLRQSLERFLAQRELKLEWLALPFAITAAPSDLLAIRMIPIAGAADVLIALDTLAALLKHERKISLLVSGKRTQSGIAYCENILLAGLLESVGVFTAIPDPRLHPLKKAGRLHRLKQADLEQVEDRAGRTSLGLRAFEAALTP